MSLDRFEKMTQREKDEFSKICNKLMSATYMLRDGTDKLVSREYRFIENEFELFSDYLSLGGWKIYKDAQYGIIYVRNVEGYNKLACYRSEQMWLTPSFFVHMYPHQFLH